MKKISVFLSDYQVLVREGIHFTLSNEEDIVVTGETTSNEDALSFIESNPPRVAILNANCGQLTGVEVTRRIKQNLPRVSVVLLMDSESEEQLFQAMKSGASACVTKDVDPSDLINIVRDVARGGEPISEALLRPGLSARVLDEFEVYSSIDEPAANRLVYLTFDEAEMLRHIAERSSGEQVVGKLGMSRETISHQLVLILHKLVSNNRIRQEV